MNVYNEIQISHNMLLMLQRLLDQLYITVDLQNYYTYKLVTGHINSYYDFMTN